jgi:hypothetical protein
MPVESREAYEIITRQMSKLGWIMSLGPTRAWISRAFGGLSTYLPPSKPGLLFRAFAAALKSKAFGYNPPGTITTDLESICNILQDMATNTTNIGEQGVIFSYPRTYDVSPNGARNIRFWNLPRMLELGECLELSHSQQVPMRGEPELIYENGVTQIFKVLLPPCAHRFGQTYRQPVSTPR